MLDRVRAHDIEREAWTVLESREINDDSNLPIQPIVLAESQGISVQEVVFRSNDVSGAISKRNGGVSIVINTLDAPNRRRFTVAHELGHYYLHLGANTIGDPTERVDYHRTLYRENSHSPEEEEANRFAAALLMPIPILRQALRSVSSIEELAASFGVSNEAMSIRLKTLQREPELLYAFN